MPGAMAPKISTNGRAWGVTHKAVKMGVGKQTGTKKGSAAQPPNENAYNQG